MDNPNPTDDRIKYHKTQAQATLNASVKAVETAKLKLDQADLFCPVNGTVIFDGRMRARMSVTPGAYAYEILDQDSLVISMESEQEESDIFKENVRVSVRVRGKDEKLEGIVLPLIPTAKGKPVIRIKPEKTEGLELGESCEVMKL